MLLANAAAAQCDNQWLQSSGIADIDGWVSDALEWDPDGAGPSPSLFVVCGGFTIAGTVPAANIAAFDFASGRWQPLGNGVGGVCNTLEVLPGGDLVAGGAFTWAGGVSANHVARWDGSSWSALGTGTDAPVFDMTVLPNGELIAGGMFGSAGGVPCSHIARWDGSQWGPMASAAAVVPGVDNVVYCLATLPNGDCFAGGTFLVAGAYPASYAAAWNGTSWGPVGQGLGGQIQACSVLPSGDLVVSGSFVTVGGVPASGLASWDGTAWSTLGAGPGLGAWGILGLANGDVIVTAASFWPEPLLRRWDGSLWTDVDPGPRTGYVNAIWERANGHLIALGDFTIGMDPERFAIRRWNGTEWGPLAGGTNGNTTAVTIMPNGDRVVAGSFTTIAGVPARHIARWHGGQWLPLGTGTNFPPSALQVMPNGDLIVGGNFTEAGGVIANGIARWDGSSWSALGAGTNGFGVRALCVLPDGTLLAGGDFNIAGGVSCDHVARWDGSSWSPMGGGLDGRVSALVVMPQGYVVAGGQFLNSGLGAAEHLAVWYNLGWGPVGVQGSLGTNGEVLSLLAGPEGNVVIGGAFTVAGNVAANGLARWRPGQPPQAIDGIQGAVHALHRLPNGDLVAGGDFGIPTTGTHGLGRYNGTTWSWPDHGVDDTVLALAQGPDGNLIVGGGFRHVAGRVAAGLAELTTTCPATVSPAGAGCAGAAGWSELRSTSLPWLGSSFTAQATGQPMNGLVVLVTGTSTTAQPLWPLLPEALAGCMLLASPDVALDLYVSAGGTVAVQTPLPDVQALANVVLHQQIVAFDLDATGSVAAVTSSNALRLVLGAF